jgi:hypothetical protein
MVFWLLIFCALALGIWEWPPAFGLAIMLYGLKIPLQPDYENHQP